MLLACLLRKLILFLPLLVYAKDHFPFVTLGFLLAQGSCLLLILSRCFNRSRAKFLHGAPGLSPLLNVSFLLIRLKRGLQIFGRLLLSSQSGASQPLTLFVVHSYGKALLKATTQREFLGKW